MTTEKARAAHLWRFGRRASGLGLIFLAPVPWDLPQAAAVVLSTFKHNATAARRATVVRHGAGSSRVQSCMIIPARKRTSRRTRRRRAPSRARAVTRIIIIVRAALLSSALALILLVSPTLAVGQQTDGERPKIIRSERKEGLRRGKKEAESRYLEGNVRGENNTDVKLPKNEALSTPSTSNGTFFANGTIIRNATETFDSDAKGESIDSAVEVSAPSVVYSNGTVGVGNGTTVDNTAADNQTKVADIPLGSNTTHLVDMPVDSNGTVGNAIAVNKTTTDNQTKVEEAPSGDNATHQQQTADHGPLNVILFYTDDWRHDMLGVGGNPHVQTPNLDKLAAEGMRFTHNCVTTAVCWISRATLLTGQYLSRHGQQRVHDPLIFYEDKEAWADTYPILLRKNGYYTGHVGKWQFKTYPKEEFDYAGEKLYAWHWNDRTADGKWSRHPNEGLPEDLPEGERVHITRVQEQDAMKFLQSRPTDGTPFQLTISYFAPHADNYSPDQWNPQEGTMNLYNDITVRVPLNGVNPAESWDRMPYSVFQSESIPERQLWKKRYNEEAKADRMMKNFYRMITETDESIGRILAEVERQGVLNQTMIIFTSDNGMFHGEHGLSGKRYPHQESIRVPLIIRDPRMPPDKVGTTRDDFTLNIDLAPTIVGAAGVNKPKRMQGRDISELYLDKQEDSVLEPWREDFVHEFLHHRFNSPSSVALVRKDYKYIEWTKYNVSQLFDLELDPYEENDLIRSKREDYKDIASELQARLKDLQESIL